MNFKGQRLYIDEPDHKGLMGVRFSGRHSGHIGVIAPVYGSGASFGEHSSWLFAGMDAIGDELARRMKDTLIQQIKTHVVKLNSVWVDMVGDPSPDSWTKELYIGKQVDDELNGQKVKYHDVNIYDINLGAIMMRYETAGWSDWFYWSPGTWLCDTLKGKTGTSHDYFVLCNQVRSGWAELTNSTHGHGGK